MKEKYLFYSPNFPEETALPHDEAVHAVRVLRLKEGEHCWVTNGRGDLFLAQIVLCNAKTCILSVLNQAAQEKYWTGEIELAVAPTKNMDRIEWLAEKATEIGWDSFSLLRCDNSERKVVKTERIEKIVVAAMKQSHKCQKPIIHEMVSFNQYISDEYGGQKFIAHCYLDSDIYRESSNKRWKTEPLSELAVHEGKVRLLIGPEGDFSINEVRMAIDNGYAPISLGPARLRTETAALVGLFTLNAIKKKKSFSTMQSLLI